MTCYYQLNRSEARPGPGGERNSGKSAPNIAQHNQLFNYSPFSGLIFTWKYHFVLGLRDKIPGFEIQQFCFNIFFISVKDVVFSQGNSANSTDGFTKVT